MDELGPLSLRQTQALGRLVGLAGPVRATLLKRGNHVWRLEAGQDVLFLKTYTKSWYGDDAAATAYCVMHEADAWAVLAAHGLATPEVVLARRDSANPLGRPFLLTRALPGRPLTTLLAEHATQPDEMAALLWTAGAYLRRMHAVTFPYPGYVVAGGPTKPLEAGAWHHRCWTAEARQRDAEAMLRAEASDLPSALVARLAALFAGMAATLAATYDPPRFTHGDCHAHQVFLEPADDGWRVTGMLDLEVASAGDVVEDLLKLGVELAMAAPAARWWEPLFAGYGGGPAFAPFRLRLAGMAAAEFGWPGSRAAVLDRILDATTWDDLFLPSRAGR